MPRPALAALSATFALGSALHVSACGRAARDANAADAGPADAPPDAHDAASAAAPNVARPPADDAGSAVAPRAPATAATEPDPPPLARLDDWSASPLGEVTMPAGLDDELLRLQPTLLRCYRKGLATSATQRGAPVFFLHTDPAGIVETARVRGDGLSDAVVACLETSLKGAALAPTLGDGREIRFRATFLPPPPKK